MSVGNSGARAVSYDERTHRSVTGRQVQVLQVEYEESFVTQPSVTQGTFDAEDLFPFLADFDDKGVIITRIRFWFEGTGETRWMTAAINDGGIAIGGGTDSEYTISKDRGKELWEYVGSEHFGKNGAGVIKELTPASDAEYLMSLTSGDEVTFQQDARDDGTTGDFHAWSWDLWFEIVEPSP